MSDRLPEPAESDNLDCHLQRTGMGTLICRAADTSGQHSTNEVTPAMCFSCAAGKIYRDVGCSSVTAKIRVVRASPCGWMRVETLFCLIRKRPTTLEYCQSCKLVPAETTRNIVTTVRGLFRAQGFHEAYQDIEKLREAIREGEFDRAITLSIACLESVMKACHHRLDRDLPRREQITDLWRSTRELLRFSDMDAGGPVIQLLNSLGGMASGLGSVRNALSDAHGRSPYSPAASEMIAELAANAAMTLATAIIRRLREIQEEADGDGRGADQLPA